MKILGFAGEVPATLDRLAFGSPASDAASRLITAPFGASGKCGVVGEHTAAGDGVLIAVCGRPLFADTEATPAATTAANPAELALRAYHRHGVQLPELMSGSFALAVVDSRRRESFLAIDRMGIERLVFAVKQNTVVFSDSAIEVARLTDPQRVLRPQSLYDYLLLHIVPSPETIFKGVRKLRPGTCAMISGGDASIKRYWTPLFHEGQSESFDVLKADLHQGLSEAVKSSEANESSGAFLSGGLDSSSVAGMLSKVARDPVQTFSVGFSVESYDELAYARIANKRFGTVGHELHVTAADITSSFEAIAAAYDEPFGNSSAVPTYFCAKAAAQHGVHHLLAGDGGDEIFGGNERYVRQRVFELYQRIPAALRKLLIEPVARRVHPESMVAPLRKLRSYTDQARIPMPERLESWNFVYRHGAEAILDPELLAAIDPQAPLRNMKEVYDSVPDATLLNHMLFYDWHFTLADNDLRKVTTMCELAGVRVSYPMLDSRVVDVSLRVPSAMKIEGTELRSFYKRAMADFLPQQIIRKSKHGFGLPFGVWLKTDSSLRALILGHLDSLRSRRIVRSTFLDEITKNHESGDASFYGYPIWDLAMLDAWMTAHAVSL